MSQCLQKSLSLRSRMKTRGISMQVVVSFQNLPVSFTSKYSHGLVPGKQLSYNLDLCSTPSLGCPQWHLPRKAIHISANQTSALSHRWQAGTGSAAFGTEMKNTMAAALQRSLCGCLLLALPALRSRKPEPELSHPYRSFPVRWPSYQAGGCGWPQRRLQSGFNFSCTSPPKQPACLTGESSGGDAVATGSTCPLSVLKQ